MHKRKLYSFKKIKVGVGNRHKEQKNIKGQNEFFDKFPGRSNLTSALDPYLIQINGSQKVYPFLRQMLQRSDY